MKKKITCIFLVLALLIACLPQVFAADSSAMTDLQGHWAEASISSVMEAGLFTGVSSTEFDPDGVMTRGMFVTVLGRMAGVNAEEDKDWYAENLSSLFADVDTDAYYAPYVAWAVRMGIAYGTGVGCFSPDDPVTREQMAAMLIRYASISNYVIEAVGSSSGAFTDADQIADYAADAVESLRITGILKGIDNGDGTCNFSPKRSLTRAECAAVLDRLSGAMYPYTDRTVVEPAGITISAAAASVYVWQTVQLSAAIEPADATNQTITWVSSDPEVATVDRNGTVYAQSAGTAVISAYTWNGLVQSCTVTATVSPSLASADETYAQKCLRVFGTVVSDPRKYYASAEEARTHMVTISVQVWDFADSSRTTKVTRTKYLTVNECIAATVEAIFEEIYNGDEQFPIKSVGCYRYEYGSEHCAGLAIDINPNENYECRADGTALTGSYWKPGEDPYSIPLDGDVANAFAKYGFTQGAYWKSTRDYMHFSYFAT